MNLEIGQTVGLLIQESSQIVYPDDRIVAPPMIQAIVTGFDAEGLPNLDLMLAGDHGAARIESAAPAMIVADFAAMEAQL